MKETQNPPSMEEELGALDICMEKLSDRCRELLNAYYFEGKTLVLYAKEKNQKIGTVQNMLFRIREVLRKCVQSFLKREEFDV